MSAKQNLELDEVLARQLAHLKKYGELIDSQQRSIEESDYKGLLDILSRKEKVISRMGDMEQFGALVGDSAALDESRKERTGRLFEELIARLDFFAAREAECVAKASELKAELAGGIHTLRKGKRMLRRYKQNSGSAKARFKDLTG